MKAARILILSRSTELYSTRSIYHAARRRKHFVRVLDHMYCDLLVRKGRLKLYYMGQRVSEDYDAVIPRIGYTATQEGVSVITQLIGMGLYSTVTPQSLIQARDKFYSLQLLAQHGVAIPKTIFIKNIASIQSMAKLIDQYPKIIKLTSGTHGSGVFKVDDESMLVSLLESFIGMKQQTLLQEFIPEASGEDVRAFVVGDRVVASMVRQSTSGDFRSNLHRGGEGKKATLTAEETQLALKATRVMGLDVAGVDILRSDIGPLVIEINASPGLEGIETVTRIDVAKKIIQLVESKLKNRAENL